MSKTRKFLGILLAITLIINVFAVAAYALSTEGGNTTNACSWALDSAAFTTAPAAGTNFTVDVVLTTNYKTGVIQFALDYDKTVFTAVSVAASAAYEAAFPNPSVVGNPDTAGTSGLYKVSMVPSTEGVSTLPAIELTAAVIATVTFTYNGGSGTIAVKDDYKTEEEPGGTLCAYRAANGNIVTSDPDSNFVCGQAVAVAEASTVTAAGAAAELAKKSTGEAGVYIDTTKKFGDATGATLGAVYGFARAAAGTFKTNAYLSKNFEATNGGSLVFTTSDNKTAASGNYGTGSTITVKNSDGSVVGKYVVVIFGDVDGNGLINVNDAKVAVAAISDASQAPLNSAKRMAANCQATLSLAPTMMHMINVNDVKNLIPLVTAYNITTVATRMSTVTTFYQ